MQNPDPLEKVIETKCKKIARDLGWLAYKWVSPGHIGVPDGILIDPKGRVVFVEFKRLGKKPTPMQLREHVRLRQHGCEVWVIDSIDLFKLMIGAK